MTQRHVPPRYLRVVVATEEQSVSTDLSCQAEAAESEVDRVLRPIVVAGRSIIGAGVAAIVDVAADYGLDWDHDRNKLRGGIADIVGRQLHDNVIAVCTRDGIRPEAAAHHLLYGEGIDAAADAITSGIIEEIGKALHRYGCPGGLGDSRALRVAVRSIVARNISAREWLR
jgi:hypothetical protein